MVFFVQFTDPNGCIHKSVSLYRFPALEEYYEEFVALFDRRLHEKGKFT